MFSAVIVEDEELILDLMKHIIGQSNQYVILGAFVDPHEALAAIPILKPDVLFLDVEMPRMNGMELARQINEVLDEVKIIFTTAYKQYALEAFQVYAFDYILKPVTPAAIERITNRLLKQPRPPKTAVIEQRKAVIRLFGGLEIRNMEGVLVHFPTRKAEELLAYFLCHPAKEISKWQLIDRLWPEMEEDRATANLHNTVYRVKKMLREHSLEMDILKLNDGYMLELGTQLYDVLEYQRATLSIMDASIDVILAEQLCMMYQGALLNGKDYIWKLPLEEALYRQYSAMMLHLLQIDLATRSWENAELKITTFLRQYPLHEEMNQALIELYVQTGKRERAMKHYSKFEVLYRDEYDCDPPEELQRLAALAK
ncbi:response regulator [Paenibacillus albiflavus]|uniref:Response regulator n=1 Tax=Paenibacillus albiflavus TaxID=2545760 RepID=A0A4R4E5L7_9BACL|nr:response regulator [Paenibacillus albiflavus]TCZ74040.1 response regulator [Paenibacillus albiflavus]